MIATPVASSSQLPPAIPTSDPPKPTKLSGHDFYTTTLRSPKYIVAPMVDQSHLAFRILCRLYGAQLCYTPMIHSGLFSNPKHDRYHHEMFDFEHGEEGCEVLDRPLVAQVCGHDKETVLKAAEKLAASGRVDAIDLNLGCPQGIAKRGRYGSFLMDDLPPLMDLISHLDKHLSVPFTVKCRAFPAVPQTLDYARSLVAAGAQMLTFHARTRIQKGQATGVADWSLLKKVRDEVGDKVAVIGNGNVLWADDVEQCIDQTGVDGVMSAEGILYNPALFQPLNAAEGIAYRASLPSAFRAALDSVDSLFPTPTTAPSNILSHPSVAHLALQYLSIVGCLKTATALSSIKAHLYKLFRPVWGAGKHLDLREQLHKATLADDKEGMEKVKELWAVAEDMRIRLQGDRDEGTLSDHSWVLPPLSNRNVTPCPVPYSLAQPFFRPLAPTTATPTTVDSTATSEPCCDQPASKRLRLGASAPQGEPGVKSSFQPTSAVLSCSVPSCTNTASLRCPRLGCKSCCATIVPSTAEVGEEGREGKPCKGHEERLEREKEREVERRKKKAEGRKRGRGKKEKEVAASV